MNQDIKEQWVQALRSGKYQQGVGTLHDVTNNLYCCLGVLCELAVEAGVVTDVHEEEDGGGVRITWYDGSPETLPDKVVLWADLKSNDPSVELEEFSTEASTCLSELNDRERYSFEKIADVIEQKL